MESDEMFKLGEAVFLEGVKKLKECKALEPQFIYKRSSLIIKKRLAVVEFNNGLELILKAILVKNGYCIYKFKNNEIFKFEDKVKDIVKDDMTIDISQVVAFFRKNNHNLPWDGVEKLRKLRNQIVHRGTNIDKKKRIYFKNAIDSLIGIYSLNQINHRKFLKEINAAKSQF